MRRGIGIVCLVAGVLLLAWGYNIAQSLKGQMHRILTSSTNNRTTWLYLGGAVLRTAGVFQIYSGKN